MHTKELTKNTIILVVRFLVGLYMYLLVLMMIERYKLLCELHELEYVSLPFCQSY